jgi:hypothetical protein
VFLTGSTSTASNEDLEFELKFLARRLAITIRFQATMPVKTTFAPRNTRTLERAHPKRNQQNQALANIKPATGPGGHEHVNQRIVFDVPQAQGHNGRHRIGDLPERKGALNSAAGGSDIYPEFLDFSSSCSPFHERERG